MHRKSSCGAQHTVSTQQILELITVLLSKVYVITYEKKTIKQQRQRLFHGLASNLVLLESG